MARQEYGPAAEHFSRALQIDPAMAHVHSWLGLALSQQGLHVRAEKAFREVIRVAPRPADYINLGLALASQHRFDEAIGAYTRALQMEPGSALCFFNRGKAYIMTGRGSEAIADMKRVVEIDSRFLLAWMDLAMLYARAGNRHEALWALDRAMALRSEDPGAVIGITRLLRELGETGRARQYALQHADLLKQHDPKLLEELRQQ